MSRRNITFEYNAPYDRETNMLRRSRTLADDVADAPYDPDHQYQSPAPPVVHGQRFRFGKQGIEEVPQ